MTGADVGSGAVIPATRRQPTTIRLPKRRCSASEGRHLSVMIIRPENPPRVVFDEALRWVGAGRGVERGPREGISRGYPSHHGGDAANDKDKKRHRKRMRAGPSQKLLGSSLRSGMSRLVLNIRVARGLAALPRNAA